MISLARSLLLYTALQIMPSSFIHCIASSLALLTLQSDLNSLVSWFSKWNLPLNVSKCFLHICTSDNDHPSYSLNNSPLTGVVTQCDLGITTSFSLWSKHCSSICSSAYYWLHFVCRNLPPSNSRTALKECFIFLLFVQNSLILLSYGALS